MCFCSVCAMLVPQWSIGTSTESQGGDEQDFSAKQQNLLKTSDLKEFISSSYDHVFLQVKRQSNFNLCGFLYLGVMSLLCMSVKLSKCLATLLGTKYFFLCVFHWISDHWSTTFHKTHHYFRLHKGLDNISCLWLYTTQVNCLFDTDSILYVFNVWQFHN